MMVVPRQYVQAPRRARSSEFREKGHRNTQSPLNTPRASPQLSSSLFRSRESSPEKSISRSQSLRVRLQPQRPERKDVPQRPQPTPLPQKDPIVREESVKDVLSATAIPIRRKQRGRLSQRLPTGDHVSNFSSLLMDDVKPSIGRAIPRSISSSNFDGLFGCMDELLEDDQMYIGSEGLDSGILTTRSMSDDSLVSLPSPDEHAFSDHNSQHSCTSQGASDRKVRMMATSEDCSSDHPLSLLGEIESFSDYSSDRAASPPAIRKMQRKSMAKNRTLKSSLTASLKALKSAAQSVSYRSSSGSADVKAQALFEFDPTLTDDRRPPASLEEPTPELRRYLNPLPLDSAAQLHFWQDHRHSSFDRKPDKESRKRVKKPRKSSPVRSRSPPGENPLVRDLPSIVQLANFLPPSVRTENASSPPIWLTSDGVPVNKQTSIPLLYDPNANDGKGEPVAFRHREPRENRDFLRVFVCEMQMRRKGKLSDDLSAGRARLWLPPVGSEGAGTKPRREGDAIDIPADNKVRKKRDARQRMTCVSIDDV